MKDDIRQQLCCLLYEIVFLAVKCDPNKVDLYQIEENIIKIELALIEIKKMLIEAKKGEV